MKKIIGLMIMAIAVTLIVPQISSAELREDTRRYRRAAAPLTIDYALRTLESLNQRGDLKNKGIYKALLKQLSSAKRLVANDQLEPARNILNAAGKLLGAQSGKLISDRGAYILKSIIVRIRL